VMERLVYREGRSDRLKELALVYCGWASLLFMYNCLIDSNKSGNTGGGVYLSSDSYSDLSNCTLAYNSAFSAGGIRGAATTHLTVLNSILWGDSPDEIYGEINDLSVTYTDIQGGHAGEGNLDLDPLFVTGPWGHHCLSHLGTGHLFDSPCINSGSDLSETICFDSLQGQFCLNTLTTRTDALEDDGQVDMGYHYAVTTPSCIHHGDVNLNGEITAEDAQKAFMIALGAYTPTVEEACAADCNSDGSVTAGDAQGIFAAALGMGECADPL